MRTVRAIDVGFGVTKYIRRADGEHIECAMFPSLSQFDSSDYTEGDSFGQRFQVASVPQGPHFHTVGPDVEMVMDAYRPINARDNYTDSAAYAAYLRGALHFMDVDVIDLLVLGLPVADLTDKRKGLVRLAEGEHRVGGGRTVLVKRALVLAQPQGALVTYASQAGVMDRVQHQENLVIDAGTRTFDWVVSRGLRLQTKRSHSANAGVVNVLNELAYAIARDLKVPSCHCQGEVDRALFTGEALRLFGRPYSLDKHKQLIAKVVDRGVGEMLERIGNVQQYDNVVLAGGGSFLFRKRIQEEFGKHAVVELGEPIYANVRGFQVAGEGQLDAQGQGQEIQAEVKR